jgi:hypothetical protein
VRGLPASGRDPAPTITALPIGSRNRLARRPYTASQNALNRDGGARGGSSDIYALQTRRALFRAPTSPQCGSKEAMDDEITMHPDCAVSRRDERGRDGCSHQPVSEHTAT